MYVSGFKLGEPSYDISGEKFVVLAMTAKQEPRTMPGLCTICSIGFAKAS
jgi:hypothetical protein